jgi:pSer/pThr/pTyr-binding forkhead associated (FHA) protein
VLVESAYAETGAPGARSFRTEFVDANEALSRALPNDKREVFLVKKRSDSTFSGHVGLGRTPNLDISIARTGVSKFHAYFSETDGLWKLTDKDSTNGTFVAGTRPTPGTPAVVTCGVEVQFANHAFQFLTPRRFYELLRSLT